MMLKSASISLCPGIFAAVSLGVLGWYDQLRTSWHNDLAAPMNDYFLLAMCVVASLFIYFVIAAFVRRSPNVFTVNVTLFSLFLPILNAFISLFFYLIGSQIPEIYFISEDGMGIVLTDSIIFAVIGGVFGALIGSFSKVLYRPALP